MQADLKDLIITEAEVEKLTGLDVSEAFIGGVLGGVIRTPIFHGWQRLASILLTELAVFILTFILTIPLGLMMIRGVTGSISDPVIMVRFLQLTLGLTGGTIVGWNGYMIYKSPVFQSIARLLDEIDRYNEVIRAVDMADQLEAIGQNIRNFTNRQETLSVLSLTRETIVCGLMTDKILRENRGWLARRHDLFQNIEQNFTALQAFEMTTRANEYGQLLDEALQIGLSVYREVQSQQDSDRPMQ